MKATLEEIEVGELPKKHSCGDCGTKHKIRKWAVRKLSFGGELYLAHHFCGCGAGVLSFLVAGDHDEAEMLEAVDAYMQDKKR